MPNYGQGAGFVPEPKTAGEWTERWTRERTIWVPRTRSGIRYLQLSDVAPVPPGQVPGDPDLLMTVDDGRRFYLLFPRSQTFRSLQDLPLLVYPVDRGVVGAFWLMPVGR